MLRTGPTYARLPRSRPPPCLEDNNSSQRAALANVPCRFFARGNCGRGDACWFKHDPSAVSSAATRNNQAQDTSILHFQLHSSLSAESRLGTTSADAPGSTSSPPRLAVPVASQASTSSSTSGSSTSATEDLQCIICFEKPTRFGLLEACAHVYCLTCIRDWRTQKGKTPEQIEAGVLLRCPACRATSGFVIPADIWLPAGERKTKFIQEYKSRLASIPCRHFDLSPSNNRYCPFGKDCFYAHRNDDGTPHIFTHNMAEHLTQHRRRRDQRQLEHSLRNFYSLWRSGRLDDGPLMHPAYRGDNLSDDGLDENDNILGVDDLTDHYLDGEDDHRWGADSYFDTHELRSRMFAHSVSDEDEGDDVEDYSDDWDASTSELSDNPELEERFQSDMAQAIRESLALAEAAGLRLTSSVSNNRATRPLPTRTRAGGSSARVQVTGRRAPTSHQTQETLPRQQIRQSVPLQSRNVPPSSDRLLDLHRNQARQNQPVIEFPVHEFRTFGQVLPRRLQSDPVRQSSSPPRASTSGRSPPHRAAQMRGTSAAGTETRIVSGEGPVQVRGPGGSGLLRLNERGNLVSLREPDRREVSSNARIGSPQMSQSSPPPTTRPTRGLPRRRGAAQ